MKIKYDNSDRLDAVTDKEWREALDEVTAYLRWRLAGKTQRGAHSEQALGMPALDYYQEEAVIKLIEGEWKWQERFTLGKQLEKIAADLVTKQTQKWLREHGTASQSEELRVKSEESFGRKVPEFIELSEPERLPEVVDDDGQKALDETYDLVYGLVEDDKELTIFVSAIEHCGNFKDLPEHTGWEMKKVYRLMEKLMRRIRKLRVKSEEFFDGRSGRAERRVEDRRNNGLTELGDDGTEEGKKGMKFIDKIYRFEAERKSAEENYNAFGADREEHQKRMIAFVHQKLDEAKGERKK